MTDITRNLLSLQFESGLPESEQNLACIRKQTHALAVSACAQITYLASAIRDSRLIAVRHCSVTNGYTGATATKPSCTVAIIGGGRIGQTLADCLLSFGEISAKDLVVSTRRPELLAKLSEKGVTCMFDNCTAAKSASLLILCCLPSQLPAIADDIRPSLQRDTVVFSIVSATPLSRLQKLLGTNNVLRPQMSTVSDGGHSQWDFTMDVCSVLGVREMLEKTCPLSLHKHTSVVTTPESFAALLVYAVANSLSDTQLTTQQQLSVINALTLGHTKHSRLSNVFSVGDFQLDSDAGCISLGNGLHYSLVELASMKETPIGRRLSGDDIRRAFVTRYCDVFQQHLMWFANAGIGSTKKHLDIIYD